MSALRGDHHNTVGGLGTVKGRCRSTFQNRDILNVFGVDVDETVRADALVAPVAFVVGLTVVDRHTVEHDERLGCACD